MVNVIGVNAKTCRERGIVLEIEDCFGEMKICDYHYVKSFLDFTIKYADGDIVLDEYQENKVLVYMPIKEFKYFKRYVNSIDDIIDNVEFRFKETGYGDYSIIGITSNIFDVESSKETYNILYDIKKHKVIVNKE